MTLSVPPDSADRPDRAAPRPAKSGRVRQPGPWWSSLLGEWIDEPTQPLPLVDRPTVAGGPAGEDGSR
jgi:hypothetical protein